MKITENVPRFAFKNRTAIEESEVCGCYHCCRTFSKHDIIKWTDQSQTALCPLCGVDAVLPQTSGISLDAETLESIHECWFLNKKRK